MDMLTQCVRWLAGFDPEWPVLIATLSLRLRDSRRTSVGGDDETRYIVALSIWAGVMSGAAAVQAVHAQAFYLCFA